MNLEALAGMRKVIGVKQVTKLLKRQGAQVVFIAEDADGLVTEPIKASCEAQGVELTAVSTMKELGAACGIEVGAAVAAILK